MYEVETKKYVSGMVHGLGMQVVILDPDKKTILDRVSVFKASALVQYLYH